jgi:Fungal specific transcription factor domain
VESSTTESPILTTFDEDMGDCPDQREIIKFSSSSSSASISSDQFSILKLDQQTVIESLTPPSYPIKPLFSSPLTFATISGLSPSEYSQALCTSTQPPPISTSMLRLPHSLSPRSNHSQAVRFFLRYHRETITAAHYFRSHDYPKLCTDLILAMAEHSEALRHAVVAFSALIYSIKEHQGVRALAFLYYSKAMQDLRLLLNESTMDLQHCFVAVATALQLSSFDVYLTVSRLIVAILWRCGEVFSTFGRSGENHVVSL